MRLCALGRGGWTVHNFKVARLSQAIQEVHLYCRLHVCFSLSPLMSRGEQIRFRQMDSFPVNFKSELSMKDKSGMEIPATMTSA